MRRSPTRVTRFRTLAASAALTGLVASACVLGPSPTPTAEPTVPPESPSASAATSATGAPTATPEPTFTVDIPPESDPREVNVTIAPDVGESTGEIIVTVTSLADERIDEIVLRWATALDEVLFLAPFVPSDDRIREGGPPLVQDWTKWVLGPGERGEPAGTTSLGYGPLLPGATLAIPIAVERRGSGPTEFDLQLLAGNALLQLGDGARAVLRVAVP